MYEATGALSIALPASLFVLVALPLLWAIGVLTAGHRPTLVARIALAGSAGTLGWTILIAVRMAQVHAHGPRHLLAQHLGSIVRIGTLDLAFGLQCDSLGAAAVLVVGIVAFASILRSIWADRVHRGMAFVGLLTAGANLVVLAEGFAPLAVGLGLTTMSAFVIARGTSITAMVTAVAADACALFSLFFLFWALGGSFSATSGYEAEPLSRYVLVASPAPSADAKSTLAMTTSPGATVVVEDGPPLPGEPLRSPFSVEVAPSTYSFRVTAYPGATEVVVPHVVIAPARGYTLAPFGPTASLRSLGDQLAVPRALPNGAVVDARTLLATRSIAGFRATFIVAMLLGAALAARLLVAASRKRTLPLVLVLEAAVPAFVALRLTPLFDPLAVDGAAFCGIGALVALVCAGHAVASNDHFVVMRSVLAATASLVIVAAGLGDVAGGLDILVAAVLSGAAALAAVEARRDVRWLGIACAAAVGLLPIAGISSGVASMAARAVDSASSWRGFGLGIAFVVVVVVALCAAAAFRMHDAIITEPQVDLGTRATSTLALVLSSAALASGVVLGAGTAAFGGRLIPLSARVLDVPEPRGDAWTGLALAIVAPAIGLFLARRPWARVDAFAFAEGPARLLRRIAHGTARAARFLGDGVTTLDREVIADAADVAGGAFVGLARVVVRADETVRARAIGAPLGRVSDAAATRLGLDHPRVLSRVAAVAVFVMVALLALVVASSVLLGCESSAYAQEARRAGTIRLEPASGGHGPVELKPAGGGSYASEIAIVNDGKEPLVVSRIAIRGDAADPRVPAKLVARLAEGSLPVTVAPGTSRKASVSWTPERGVRQRQLFGHVIVTSSDEATGEVAMGVRAQIPGLLGPIESHVLSLLIGAPVLGALLTFLVRARGRRDDRTPHTIAIAVLAVQLALAVYVYRGFSADVARIDGNDGLQFIERVVWVRALSAEIFLGVDGIGAPALIVTSLVAFFAMLPERTVVRSAAGYHTAFLVLDAAACGALVAMDGLVFVLFVALACIAAVFLVGVWGGGDRRRVASRLAIVTLLATSLLLVAVFGAANHADPTFLVDGTKTGTTFSLPELSRVALGAKGVRFLGGPLVKVAFVLVLIAALALMAAFPFHGWLGSTLGEAPTSTSALVSLALPTIGATALLRIGVSVFPEGMRWASGVTVALGAITAAYGALGALAEKDLRKLVACATTAQAGFVLLGAGSLTPQGMSGAIVTASARALSCAVFLMLAGAIDDRVRTRDVTKLDGIASQMPGYATALAAAALGQAGVLGLGGAWGPLLSLLGALPNYAPLAIASGIALAVLAAAHLFAVARVAFGRLDPNWEKSPFLEPFGGRFPDLSPREWTSVAPLVTLVVMLGVWPAPLLGVTTGTAKDLASAVSPPGEGNF